MRQRGLTLLTALASATTIQADERPPEIEILQPGVTLTEIASHPDIATPTGVDVDDKGQIWTVACHTHFPPEDYAGPKLDEILIFKEDGSRHLFYDKTYHTMDLELGDDGWVYLAERARILRIKDTDGDGKADTEDVLATLDTEGDYPHNGLSGMFWHPDGNLIFALGENFAEPWTLSNDEGDSYSGLGEGGIFRCQPDGSNLYRLARGMWNPFGVVARSDGEIFAVENDPGERPPCRLLHVVDGADFGYQRAYGNDAHHPFVCWNGELRGTLPMVHPVGEGPCGVVELGHGLLTPSWSDHRLDFMPLKQNGATYSAERIQLIHGSRYFRPVCIAEDPRNKNSNIRTWFVTDWVDGRYPVHGYGRLWKLQIDLEKASDWIGPLTPLPEKSDAATLAETLRNGPVKKSTTELLDLADSDDSYIASAAVMALAREAEKWIIPQFKNWNDSHRTFAVLALKNSIADQKEWIPTLLDDPSPDVRFETLRWISGNRFKDYLAAVEKLLDNPEIAFTEFEAAAATYNTLHGKPEAGIRDPDMLLGIALDTNVSPAVRAHALRLLPSIPRVANPNETIPEIRLPKGINVKNLGEMLDLGAPALSLEVVNILTGAPGIGQNLLIKVATDSTLDPELRAEAITGLATVRDEKRDILLRLVLEEAAPVREEAIRCFRGSSPDKEAEQILQQAAKRFPESEDSVAAVLDPATLSADRPALTDTKAWLQRLDAIEGSPDLRHGERTFHHRAIALCSNCHRYDGRGTKVGPDLTLAHARDDREWLLHSILEPNAEIAPEYLARSITLNDGTSHIGIRLRSSTSEVIRDLNGQNRSFKRDDIQSMTELPTSLMPPGLPYMLTDRELRDLLAFLNSAE